MIGDLSINMVEKFVEYLELFGFEMLSITINYNNKYSEQTYKKKFESYDSMRAYIKTILENLNNFTIEDAIYCIDSIKVKTTIDDRTITIDTIGVMDDRKSFITRPRTEAQSISNIHTDRATTFFNNILDEYMECYTSLNRLYINEIVKYDYLCFVPLANVRENAHILKDYTEFGTFGDYSRAWFKYFKHPTLDIVEPDILICDTPSHN